LKLYLSSGEITIKPSSVHVWVSSASNISGTNGGPPITYIDRYLSLLRQENMSAADHLWLDAATAAPKGTTATFDPVHRSCRVQRDQMGMGVNAYRYIVAIPGVYRQTSPTGIRTVRDHAVFLLVRGTKQRPWSILQLTDAGSSLVKGC
jgi:hypothetical protein